jgi:hypothetical protein
MMIDRKNFLSTLRYTQTNCVNEGKKKESEGADEPASRRVGSVSPAGEHMANIGRAGGATTDDLFMQQRTKLSCQFMCVQQMKHINLDWKSESLPYLVCVYAIVSCISVKV